MRKLGLFIFAFFLSISSAQAALDQAGADTLRQAVDAAVQTRMEMSGREGQTFTMSGPITVTPKDKFYEVKLPGLEMKNERGRLVIGTIIMNAVPAKDGGYMTSMALPSTMTFFDPANKPQFTAKIGSQRFAGAWYPQLMAYTKVDSEYKNVTFEDVRDHEITGSVADIKVGMSLKQNPDGTWSGPTLGEISGFSVDIKSPKLKQASIKFEKSTMQAFYDKMNLAAAKSVSDKLAALFKGRKPEEIKPDEIKQFTQTVMKDVTSFMDGQTNSFELSNLAVAFEEVPDAADKEPSKPISFKIAKIGTNMAVTGLQQEAGKAGFKMHMENFSYAGLDPVTTGMMPTDANFDVTFDKLPMKSLSRMMGDIIGQAVNASLPGAEAPDAQSKKEDEMARTLLVLPGLLSNAGTTVTVRDTFLKSADMTSILEGTFIAKPAAKAPVPLEGAMTLAVAGMDEALAKYQTAMDTRPDIASFAQALTVAQMMGKSGKAASGKSLRTFKFEITPEGRLLMNGADLSAMTGLLGAGLASPAKP